MAVLVVGVVLLRDEGKSETVASSTTTTIRQTTTSSTATTTTTSAPDEPGYYLAGADGGPMATRHSSGGPRARPLRLSPSRQPRRAAGTPATAPIAGIASSLTGRGYWLAVADGSVLPFGDAPVLGSPDRLNQPVVGIAIPLED